MSGSHHLAQINVGRLVAPVEHPSIGGFVAALDPINALADAAPGFVWRLQTEAGDATAIRAFDDPLVIVNVSVWASIEALRSFAYDNESHRAVLRDRLRWFERPKEAHLALWWISAGHLPSVEEAVERLAHLRANGPTAHAFTFATAQELAPEPPP